MKQIDPILSIIGMIVVSIIAALISTPVIGIIIFVVLFVAGIIGDKIMGNLPSTHD